MEPEQKSLGQTRVRINFNPSANTAVEAFKRRIADLIDEVNTIALASSDHEVKRLCAKAMDDLENAAMWAVKALTA